MSCAHDIIKGIQERRRNIEDLKKILKEMDPASGVSISIRRGVARDNEEDDYDSTKRPWVLVETGELAHARVAISAAIAAAEASLKFRLVMAREEHKALTEFLETP